jgi:hypothetical protein
MAGAFLDVFDVGECFWCYHCEDVTGDIEPQRRTGARGNFRISKTNQQAI